MRRAGKDDREYYREMIQLHSWYILAIIINIASILLFTYKGIEYVPLIFAFLLGISFSGLMKTEKTLNWLTSEYYGLED